MSTHPSSLSSQQRRQFLQLAGIGSAGLLYSPALLHAADQVLPDNSLSSSKHYVHRGRHGVSFVIDASAGQLAAYAAAGQMLWHRADAFGSAHWLNHPTAAAGPFANRVFVADSGAHRIVVLEAKTGRWLGHFGRYGQAPGEFHFINDLAMDDDGKLYASDAFNHRVQVFSLRGELISFFGQLGHKPGQFNLPAGLAVDQSQRLHVVDRGNRRVQVFSNQGRLHQVYAYSEDNTGPRDLLLTADQDILVLSSEQGGSLQRYSPGGRLLKRQSLAQQGQEPIRLGANHRGQIVIQRRPGGLA